MPLLNGKHFNDCLLDSSLICDGRSVCCGRSDVHCMSSIDRPSQFHEDYLKPIVKDYGNEPFFVEKANDSKEFLEKHGLPNFTSPINNNIIIMNKLLENPKKIITLCGSLKFLPSFLRAQMYLERRGHTCLSVCAGEDVIPPTKEEKSLIDKVHFKKIMLSDCILVLDLPYGYNKYYIGESTKNEMEFAKLMNKDVYLISDNLHILQPNNL